MKKTISVMILISIIAAMLASCDIGEWTTEPEGTQAEGSDGTVQETEGSTAVPESGDSDNTDESKEESESKGSDETETKDFYEEMYVDPDTVRITDKDNNARNLIYIYLESMENTYASIADGGYQQIINYIPNLTSLASSNISFSDRDKLGGFRAINGTGWTMGALMGTTSGIPFSLAIFGENSQNKQGKDGTFVNGATTLGDILAEKGYVQEFLCGSDAKFGGRKTYFTVHGGYKIFDLYTAIEKGYVEEHNGWWGFDDKTLYQIAKDELAKLAEGDQPFNFTMLTVDTHRPSGYKCELCAKKYPYNSANVVDCADSQIESFIEWCKQQEFYENTTIIIVGDHPRMDKNLVSAVDMYDRTMYNCIINAAIEPSGETKNRMFTSLDMLPTALAAIGFEIDGERLAFGTNMFSKKPTLWEENGGDKESYDWLEAELSRYSKYYKENFVDKKD